MKFLSNGYFFSRLLRLLMLIFYSSLSQQAWAQPEPAVVEELLQLDTQAALQAARRNTVGPLNQVGPAVRLTGEGVLLAIYGVGSTLTAEILLDAELHIFKSRRAKAFVGRSVHYTLERIEPPCLYLKKDDRPEVFCLGQIRP